MSDIINPFCFSASCKKDHSNDTLKVPWHAVEERWCTTNPCPYTAKWNEKYLLYCSECDHVTNYPFAEFIHRPYACGICTSALCKDENCEKCFLKSAASLCCIDERWCTNNPDPRTLNKHSKRKVCLYCPECGHLAMICLGTLVNNPWTCKFCTNTLCEDENCEWCFEASCASIPGLVQSWSPKNQFTPRQVRKSADRKIIFLCCGLETISTALARTGADCKCPCCNKKSPPCGRPKEECERCYKRSFACSPAVEYYLDEDTVPAISISANSLKKGRFFCDEGHKYSQQFGKMTIGYGCPACKNKGEKRMYKLFVEQFGLENVEREFTFDECRRRRCLPFDFLLFDKVLVELDGRQHYELVPYFKGTTLEQRQEIDRYKNECAKKHGYHMVRVKWENFYYYRNNCTPNLLEVIAKLLEIEEPRFVKVYGAVTWD